MISRRCQVVVLFRVFRGSIVSPSWALPLHHAESLLESHRGGPGNLARPGGLGTVDPRAAEYTRLYEEIIRRVQASPVQSVVGELAPWW